jgi:hypothetical protein
MEATETVLVENPEIETVETTDNETELDVNQSEHKNDSEKEPIEKESENSEIETEKIDFEKPENDGLEVPELAETLETFFNEDSGVKNKELSENGTPEQAPIKRGRGRPRKTEKPEIKPESGEHSEIKATVKKQPEKKSKATLRQKYELLARGIVRVEKPLATVLFKMFSDYEPAKIASVMNMSFNKENEDNLVSAWVDVFEYYEIDPNPLISLLLAHGLIIGTAIGSLELSKQIKTVL